MAPFIQVDRMSISIDFPKYPTNVAQTVVKQVNFHVKGMIGNSAIIEDEWDEIDNKFGIFDRHELRVGKCLGSGGFSDVYEVLRFNPTNIGNRVFSSHQAAARERYERKATGKGGKSKCVIKHLKADLMEEFSLFCISACDLVLEAQYLSRLNHMNILKIHGWSYGGINSFSNGKHDGYFLILERLYETLEDRVEAWRNEHIIHGNGNGRIQENLIEQLLARTRVAHGIASAVEYLHSKNIVFRDLKPDNIGFDENGVVKIFDFGLAREMPRNGTNANELFEMSGRIGTARYMAPEVLLEQRYNQKVDTYSWSVLFWFCLTLELPYGTMSRSDHATLVCEHGQRPELHEESWPESICGLLENSWAQSVRCRFSMTEVNGCLEDIQQELKPSRKRKSQCDQ